MSISCYIILRCRYILEENTVLFNPHFCHISLVILLYFHLLVLIPWKSCFTVHVRQESMQWRNNYLLFKVFQCYINRSLLVFGLKIPSITTCLLIKSLATNYCWASLPKWTAWSWKSRAFYAEKQCFSSFLTALTWLFVVLCSLVYSSLYCRQIYRLISFSEYAVCCLEHWNNAAYI